MPKSQARAQTTPSCRKSSTRESGSSKTRLKNLLLVDKNERTGNSRTFTPFDCKRFYGLRWVPAQVADGEVAFCQRLYRLVAVTNCKDAACAVCFINGEEQGRFDLYAIGLDRICLVDIHLRSSTATDLLHLQVLIEDASGKIVDTVFDETVKQKTKPARRTDANFFSRLGLKPAQDLPPWFITILQDTTVKVEEKRDNKTSEGTERYMLEDVPSNNINHEDVPTTEPFAFEESLAHYSLPQVQKLRDQLNQLSLQALFAQSEEERPLSQKEAENTQSSLLT